MKWKPSLELKIAEIDEQHRELFEEAAKLLPQLPILTDSELQEKIFHFESLLRHHFKTEEKLMRFIKYTKIDSHIKEHNRMLLQLHYMLLPSHTNKKESIASTSSFIMLLLDHHIKEFDSGYAKFLDNIQHKGNHG
jgi:hemerythrin-like metal-binding protein